MNNKPTEIQVIKHPDGSVTYGGPIETTYKDNPDGTVTMTIEQLWGRNYLDLSKPKPTTNE